MKLVAIVGPTGSGKSALAMALAGKYGSEIICADSRTIYKGMDIGTAKPSAQDRRLVPHHCLDLVSPDQQYSVAEFQKIAKNTIHDINRHQKIVFLVGGSGLYIKSVLYNMQFGEADYQVDDLGLEELQELSNELGLKPTHDTYMNPRHLAGFIRRLGKNYEYEPLAEGAVVVGLDPGKVVLDQRIEDRIELMLEVGFLAEVEDLLEKYPASSPGFLAPGYSSAIKYLEGELTFDEFKAEFIRSHKKLAKRQMTWFKRNPDIHWAQNLEMAEQQIQNF